MSNGGGKAIDVEKKRKNSQHLQQRRGGAQISSIDIIALCNVIASRWSDDQKPRVMMYFVLLHHELSDDPGTPTTLPFGHGRHRNLSLSFSHASAVPAAHGACIHVYIHVDFRCDMLISCCLRFTRARQALPASTAPDNNK